jgi:hypothetical protein
VTLHTHSKPHADSFLVALVFVLVMLNYTDLAFGPDGKSVRVRVISEELAFLSCYGSLLAVKLATSMTELPINPMMVCSVHHLWQLVCLRGYCV